MKILIAVDFTPIGRKVASYGYHVAQSNKWEATFMTCTPSAKNFFSSYNHRAALGTIGKIEQKKVNEEAKDQLDATVVSVKNKTGKDASVKTSEYVTSGDPGEEILKYAKENGFDMIIVGYKNRSGIAGLLIGSTAAKIARYAPCSVLIYRPDKEITKKLK
jgi:nucleotide-binding universal stress UspA family protein